MDNQRPFFEKIERKPSLSQPLAPVSEVIPATSPPIPLLDEDDPAAGAPPLEEDEDPEWSLSPAVAGYDSPTASVGSDPYRPTARASPPALLLPPAHNDSLTGDPSWVILAHSQMLLKLTKH